MVQALPYFLQTKQRLARVGLAGWLADLPLVSLVDLVRPGDEHHGADHGQVVGDQVSEA